MSSFDELADDRVDLEWDAAWAAYTTGVDTDEDTAQAVRGTVELPVGRIEVRGDDLGLHQMLPRPSGPDGETELVITVDSVTPRESDTASIAWTITDRRRGAIDSGLCASMREVIEALAISSIRADTEHVYIVATLIDDGAKGVALVGLPDAGTVAQAITGSPWRIVSEGLVALRRRSRTVTGIRLLEPDHDDGLPSLSLDLSSIDSIIVVDGAGATGGEPSQVPTARPLERITTLSRLLDNALVDAALPPPPGSDTDGASLGGRIDARGALEPLAETVAGANCFSLESARLDQLIDVLDGLPAERASVAVALAEDNGLVRFPEGLAQVDEAGLLKSVSESVLDGADRRLVQQLKLESIHGSSVGARAADAPAAGVAAGNEGVTAASVRGALHKALEGIAAEGLRLGGFDAVLTGPALDVLDRGVAAGVSEVEVVEFLVHPEQRDSVADVLLAAGFTSSSTSVTSADLRSGVLHVFRSTLYESPSIHLVGTIASGPFAELVDLDDFHAMAVPVRVGSEWLRGLHPAHRYVHACIQLDRDSKDDCARSSALLNLPASRDSVQRVANLADRSGALSQVRSVTDGLQRSFPAHAGPLVEALGH